MVNPKGKSSPKKNESNFNGTKDNTLSIKESQNQFEPQRFNRGSGPQRFNRGSRPQRFSRGSRPQRFNRGAGPQNFSRGGGFQNINRGGGPQNFSRGGGPQNFSRGGGPQNFSRGFGTRRPQRGFGTRRPRGGFMSQGFNRDSSSDNKSTRFLEIDASQDAIIKVHLPNWKCDKLAMEEMVRHSHELRLNYPRSLLLKVKKDTVEEKLAALREFSYEGQSLNVEKADRVINPLKKIVKFQSFGADLEEVRSHYGASSIEQAPFNKENSKPVYVMTFESRAAAEEIWSKERFSFNGDTAFLTTYFESDNKRTSEVVTESDEGSAAKKMKTAKGAKATHKVVEEEEDEDEDADEEEEEEEDEDEDAADEDDNDEDEDAAEDDNDEDDDEDEDAAEEEDEDAAEDDDEDDDEEDN